MPSSVRDYDEPPGLQVHHDVQAATHCCLDLSHGRRADAGLTALPLQALECYWGWMGHLSRSDSTACPAACALAFKNREWWRGVQRLMHGNESDERHPTRERVQRIEDPIEAAWGTHWRSRAWDRCWWRTEGRSSFVDFWARKWLSPRTRWIIRFV